MRRVEVIVTRPAASRTVRAIHRAGVMHLLPFEPPTVGPELFHEEGPGRGPRTFEAAHERVTELASLLSPAPAPPDLVRSLWELEDAALLARVAVFGDIEARTRELTAERVRLTAEIARLDGYRRLMDGLAGMLGRLPRVRGYASTGIVLAARYRPILALVRDELERITAGRCEVIAADLGTDRVAAILLYPARQAAQVAALLGGRDLEEVTLPEELIGVPFDELLPRLAAEQERLRGRLSGADDELAALSRAHGPLLAALGLVLTDRRAEVDVLSSAGGSDHLVAISGWVPQDRLDEFRRALDRDAGPEVYLIDDDPGPVAPDAPVRRDAPVALQNGSLLRAFEPLASFVAVPRYGTLDPTPLLGITLPAFIGLMVGDAGYGLLLLGLLVLARHHWPDSPAMRMLFPIGVASTIAMIGFGILFGEWFGETGRHLGLTPLWFDRRENIPALLALALSIGVAQICLGLLLGMVNARKLGHRRDLAGRLAMLAGLASLIVLLAAAAGALPGEVAAVAASVLLLATAILVLTFGIVGPIDLLGVVGNVLSYARLMAIGLAGVMLALVADRLGGLIPNVVAGLLVAGLIHALNLLLGVFDASIQGLRLHYVEFFTKFVEPGGTRYAPFAWVLSGNPIESVAGGAGGR